MRIFFSPILSAILLAGLLNSASFAQEFQSDIQTETLGDARAYDAGALTTDDRALSLGVGLWQATSASRAVSLIQAVPNTLDETHPNRAIIRDMVRSALLSAGEPPQGNREAFEAARLQAVMALGDSEALAVLTARNPVLAQSPAFLAQSALAKNDGEAACDVSDQITQGRAEPNWARLRIICHVLRQETAAAELTRDLLQNSGYQDPNYFALLAIMLRGKPSKTLPPLRADDDTLIAFMRNRLSQNGLDKDKLSKSLAFDNTQTPQNRLAALWDNFDAVGLDELTSFMSDIAFNTRDIAGSSSFDLASARINDSPQGTGQLFLLARTGDIEALKAFTQRAPQEVQPSLRDKMFDLLPPLSGEAMAALDLERFTQKAINARDIGVLQALHSALDGDVRQARLALATDSIGNGFAFGALGRDIDGRLEKDATQERARRDTMIALAMGAQISDAARQALTGHDFADGRAIPDGDVVILEGIARAGSQAELVLRIAALLDGPALDTPSLSLIIRLLNAAGLSQFAGRIAAQDFISDI